MMAAMAAEVIIRPACAARHRRAPERPAKKSADELTGDGTDHQTRACTGSRTDHIGVSGDRPHRLRLEATRLRPLKGEDGKSYSLAYAAGMRSREHSKGQQG
jgi:hypothetical protein